MIRQFTYRIEPEYDSFTIREYLSLKGYPNAVFVQLKKTPESVLLNGIWLICAQSYPPEMNFLSAWKKALPPRTFYRSPCRFRSVMRTRISSPVNKPAQMPVHPSLNHYDHTLANAVCGYYNDQEIPYTFRCVNRLDRDTTGTHSDRKAHVKFRYFKYRGSQT